MTFLQPFILWGLPLILLPVVIHLLNRLRHRPQPWAAMRFLVSATRSSVNNAKLRQWLILLLRVLAVLMLVLFLSRPLAGGWLGWALSPAPDAILLLLDRSASMEATVAGSPTTKREQAIRALSQAAKEYEENSHLILIDSALRAPLEVGRAETLNALASTSATDTAADIPGLLATGLSWLVENRAGTAEIWLASDLQRSSWQPDDARWQSLVTQLRALPQNVRIRLLALDAVGDPNRSVSVKEMIRRSGMGGSELQFTLDIQANPAKAESFPLTLALDGAHKQEELTAEGQALRWRQKMRLGDQATRGWGSFELPVDGNRRDNVAYFVYSPEAALRATVVSPEGRSAGLLRLAIGVGAKNDQPIVEVVSSANLGQAVWEANTLLVWTEALPTGALAQRIRAFAEQGGTVLFLPSGQKDAPRFEGVAWGDPQAASTERPFRIARWNEDEGPFAKSDEGLSLPLGQLIFQRRQILNGQKSVLAAFDDGIPFLVRQSLGRGEVFFCSSLPDPEWSSLGEGPVLVPMIQRLLQSGSRRMQQNTSIVCGELSTVDQARHWEAVDATVAKDIRIQAGVYRSGDRLLAVNRPTVEDDPEMLPGSEAKRLFGSLAVQMLQERRGIVENLQGEVWRIFVFAMLLFLVAEGFLILPARAARPEFTRPSSPARTGGATAEAKA